MSFLRVLLQNEEWTNPTVIGALLDEYVFIR